MKENLKTKEKPTDDPMVQAQRDAQDKQIALFSEAREILKEEYDFDDQRVKAKMNWLDSRNHAASSIQKFIEMGKRLRVMKSVEGHGKFRTVTEFVGVSDDQAEKAISLYDEFGDVDLPKTLIDAGPNKALLALKMSEDVQSEVREYGTINGEPVGSIPIRKLRQMLSDYKRKSDKLEDVIKTGSEQVAKLEKENSMLRKGLRTPNDVQMSTELDTHFEALAHIEYMLLAVNLEDLSPATLRRIKALLNFERDSASMIESDLAQRSELFGSMAWEPAPGELAEIEQRRADATLVAGGAVRKAVE